MPSRRWLIFDLGNVLFTFNTQAVLARFVPYSPYSKEKLGRVIVYSGLVDRFERGLLGKAEFMSALIQQARLDPTIDTKVYERFYSDIFTPYEATLNLLKTLASRGERLALLSNTNALHYDLICQRWPQALKPFEQFFLSYKIGLRKPEAALFKYVENRLGVPPHLIYYWDDLPATIAAARRAGWQAQVFRDLRDVRI